MSDATDPKAWVARAEEDYLLARSALRRKTPLAYGACFHAQQCAEIYFKAILVQRGASFPKAHDLQALNDLCIRSDLFFGLSPDDLDILSSYRVRVRYPGDDPTPDEAKQAMKIAQTIRRVIRRFLEL